MEGSENSEGSELLTVAEVAEVLHVHQQTVRNWLDRGELPAVRVGSRRGRVRKTDFDAFLGGGRGASKPPQDPPRPQPLAVDPEAIDALRAFGEAAIRLADALRPSGSS